VSKRTYGTGSLKVVGRSWVGVWREPGGRRFKRKVGPARQPGSSDGLTKAQAEREFARLREQEAKLAKLTRVTIEDAGKQWLARLELKGRKRSYRDNCARDLRVHLVPYFTQELARITPEDIERYILLKRETLSLNTIRKHVTLAHGIFELGIRKGWCHTNPVRLADRPVPTGVETRIKFLHQDELERMLGGEFPPDPFGMVERVIYLTAAMTGLRQGELLGLRWRDVDFAARRIRVVSTFVKGEFVDPKSIGSARSVPMAMRVHDELRLWRWGSIYDADDDLVFAHPHLGTPLDGAKLTRRFQQALARADVRKITFHQLRHTFGTRMAAAGVPLRTIQYWMGHADSKTTQIYAHYQPSEHEAAAVDAAFAA
jgi:integrase